MVIGMIMLFYFMHSGQFKKLLVTCLNNRISPQCLESHTVFLDDRNGDMPCFAEIDISYSAGFTLVCTSSNGALIAVF